MDRGACWAAVHVVTESDLTERLSTATATKLCLCAYLETFLSVSACLL